MGLLVIVNNEKTKTQQKTDNYFNLVNMQKDSYLEDNFEPSLRIGFLMALLTRSMIFVLFFFLLITHIHIHTHTHTLSLSFIDCAAYVRFEVSSRDKVRHTNACPTTTRGTVGNKRERRKERLRKENGEEMRENKKK